MVFASPDTGQQAVLRANEAPETQAHGWNGPAEFFRWFPSMCLYLVGPVRADAVWRRPLALVPARVRCANDALALLRQCVDALCERVTPVAAGVEMRVKP